MAKDIPTLEEARMPRLRDKHLALAGKKRKKNPSEKVDLPAKKK